jgi:hypothetical protein
MKVALIPPIQNLDLSQRGDLHMVLAHLVFEDASYAEFYANESKYKVLDNGAFEGASQSIQRIIKAAKMVKADEIILPDILFQGRATVQATKRAIDWLRDRGMLGKYKLHAVPQGSDREEYWSCFKELYGIPEISVLGISKVSTPKAFCNQLTKARLEVTSKLEGEQLLKDGKEIHLLGGSYDVLNEIRQQPTLVRSIDTSAPFEYARHQRLLTEAMFECPKAQLEVELPSTELTKIFIQRNVENLLGAAHAYKS